MNVVLSAIIAIKALIHTLHIRQVNVGPLCSPHSNAGTFLGAERASEGTRYFPGLMARVQAP